VRAAVAAAIALAALCLAGGSGARGTDSAGDALINADAAHAAGYTGKGVTVAILDTGIDDHNPSVAASVVAEHCFVPPDGCPNGQAEDDGPGSAQDDEGHGTEIADVIAGKDPTGVAPDASLVVVKVADDNGRTTAGQIIAGLDWVRTNHPEAKVVNVSIAGDIPLSGDCTNLTSSLQQYAASVDALVAQGTAVIAASGNNGRTNGIPAPACIPATIAVGAVYSRPFGAFTAPNVCADKVTAADELACFSNTSSQLDLLAVGGPVDVVGLGGSPDTLVGTSAAAAQVSGAAAVLLQADPSLTPASLLDLLQRTGAPIEDPRAHASHPVTSRIDLAAALGLSPLPSQTVVSPPATTPTLSGPKVPAIDLSPVPVSFGPVRRRGSATRTLVVRNVGDGYLAVRVTGTPRAVSVRPLKLHVKANGRATLQLTFRPTRAGAYSGRLRLVTDDPNAPVVLVTVRGTGR
jgi:subtilisin family serine protease